MKINVKKIKVREISGRPGEEFTLFLESKQFIIIIIIIIIISQEFDFNYLGSLITQDKSCVKEIRSRMLLLKEKNC